MKLRSQLYSKIAKDHKMDGDETIKEGGTVNWYQIAFVLCHMRTCRLCIEDVVMECAYHSIF